MTRLPHICSRCGVHVENVDSCPQGFTACDHYPSPQGKAEKPELSDAEIDPAAHKLQEVIAENGGRPSEYAYDRLRDILALLPARRPVQSRSTTCACIDGQDCLNAPNCYLKKK